MKTNFNENQVVETVAKTNRWITFAACLVACLPLLYLTWAWKSLPERVPMKYNLSGGVIVYGSRYDLLGVIGLLAALASGLMVLFYFLPRFDPKQNLKFSTKALQMIGLGTSLLLTTVSVTMIQTTLSGDVNTIYSVLPFALVAFFALMGNYLTSLRPNYFAGIRTPWTLESESVWRKTHRLGGKLLFWGSLALLPVLLLVPGGVTRMLVVAIALLVSLGYTVYYSYRIYREEQAPSQPR